VLKPLNSVAALLVCALVGCVGGPDAVSKNSISSSVRRVRFVGAPENRELAEKARQLGNAFYPEVYATLNGGTQKAPQFDGKLISGVHTVTVSRARRGIVYQSLPPLRRSVKRER